MILAKQRVTDLNKSLATPLLERINNRRQRVRQRREQRGGDLINNN